jgi:hypothetical protein
MDLRRQQKTPTEPGLLGVTDNKEKPDPSLAIADPSTLELTGAPKVRSGVPSGLREPQRAFGPLGPFPPACPDCTSQMDDAANCHYTEKRQRTQKS